MSKKQATPKPAPPQVRVVPAEAYLRDILNRIVNLDYGTETLGLAARGLVKASRRRRLQYPEADAHPLVAFAERIHSQLHYLRTDMTTVVMQVKDRGL